MLGRQAAAECSDDYRVQPGDPCVPAGTEDTISCPDIGSRDIKILGTDVYRLDGNDQDGWGCESSTTGPSTSGFDPRAHVDVAFAVLALVWAVTFSVLWWANHRRGDETERRSSVGGLYAAIALTAITVVLGIVGWA